MPCMHLNARSDEFVQVENAEIRICFDEGLFGHAKGVVREAQHLSGS